MIKYKQYFREIKILLGDSFNKIYIFFTLTVLISFLDLLGLSLIIPYISFILNLQDTNSEYFLINYIINFDYKEVIFYLSLFLLLIYFIKVYFSIYIIKKFLDFSFNEGANLRIKLAKKYINIPYEKSIEKNSADYIYSIESLTGQYANTILPSVLKFFSDLFIFFVILIFLIFVNWLIVIILFVLLFFIIIFYDLFFKRKLKIAGEKSNIFLAKLIKSINELVDGFKEIKIFSSENFFINKIKFLSINYAKVASFGQLVGHSPKYILELLVILFVVICIVFATLFGVDLNNLLPTLGVFAFASLRLAPTSTQLISNLSVIRNTRNSLSKLYEDISLSDDNNLTDNLFFNNNKVNKEAFSTYVFSNIDFKYKGSNNYIFKDASFSINRGDTISIIGPSGSGKTTLVDIILGFLKIEKGSISYNNIIVSNDLSFFRSKVAYLPQKVFLTDDSIKNNVALGKKENEIVENKVINALKKARLEEFINYFEKGIQTTIGERGVKISGGQKQRIAIARAFYYNRDVLILDESTNSLDKENEKEILSELKKSSKEVTIITISHDDSFKEFCNKILKIENNKIIEINT